MSRLDDLFRNTPIQVTELNIDVEKPLDKPWVSVNGKFFVLDMSLAKADIKALMLELIGEDEAMYTARSNRKYRNELKAELRKKVEAL